MTNQDTVNADASLKTELGDLLGDRTKEKLYEIPRRAAAEEESLVRRVRGLAVEMLRLTRDAVFLLPFPGKKLLGRLVGRAPKDTASESERRAA